MERITDNRRNHGCVVQLSPSTCNCMFHAGSLSSRNIDNSWFMQAGTFALEDLSLHRECIEPLRREREAYPDDTAVLDVDAFPLLDSFLKESSRCSVSDAGESLCLDARGSLR